MSSRMWLLLGALLLLAVVVTLVACQPARVLNALTPKDRFTLEQDLSYGPEPRQTLDIYRPRGRPIKQAVLMFVYGGSWENGSKDQFLFVGEAFARMGYITIIPNYRLYPEVLFPDFVNDVALAAARLHELLPEGCPDGRELILMGHSAGGHTAAMLATDPKYLERMGAGDVRVRALIGLAAPYDLPLDHELVVDKFDGVDNNIEANPLNLATAEAPPSLLLHGADDTTAYPYHTERLRMRLETLEVPVTAHVYPGVRHIPLLAGLATRLSFLHPARKDIEAYLAERGLDEECPSQVAHSRSKKQAQQAADR